MREEDPSLARLQRTALLIWGVSVVVALVAFPLRVALGVLGGGLAVAVSYLGLKQGVDRAIAAAGAFAAAEQGSAASPGDTGGRDETDRSTATPTRGRRGRPLAALVKVFTRYLLIGLILYVMISVFGAHPLALVWGASSIVVAAAIEAVRQLVSGRPRKPHGKTPPPPLDR